MDAVSIWNYFGQGAGLLSGYVYGSQQGASQNPPTITIDTHDIRSPLHTVIQIALLHFKTPGTKIFFISNGISYQSPGMLTKVSRTWSYYLDPQKGAGKEYLTKLEHEIDLALLWYPPTPKDLKLLEIYKIAKLGLKSLAKTYEGTLVTAFCSQSIRKIKKTIKSHQIPIQAIQEEPSQVQDEPSEETAEITQLEPKEPIPFEPKQELSKKIKTLFFQERIDSFYSDFMIATKQKNCGQDSACRHTVKSIQQSSASVIKELQAIIEAHYKEEAKLT